MSWIKTIDYSEADANLKRMYDRVKGPDNNVDNVLKIHSLRPHTLTGHMTLYKSVLHNSNNSLPKWYLEAIGVYVSYLNKCNYCVEHHFEAFARLLDDNEKSVQFLDGVQNDTLESFFDAKCFGGIIYARLLNLRTIKNNEDNNLNRMVVGLGVNTEGDVIGLSPNDNDNPKDWNHQ
jgi:AhpD family alkylhydroperoxidase